MQKVKLIVLAIIVAGLALLPRLCGKAELVSPGRPALKSGEQAKVTIDRKRGTITSVKRTRDGLETVEKVKVPRKAEITVSKNGNIEVKTNSFGVGFSPGIVAGFEKKLSLGLDAELLYWQYFGICAGSLIRPEDKVQNMFKPYVGISFAPVWRYTSNTSMLVGITVDKNPMVGIRLSF